MDFERKYDILVLGGGIAGVCAALEAARAGFRTALVEKTVFLGGLATTGLIQIYLPLCDGRGRQVLFGLVEELLHLSLKYGPGDVPGGWPGGPEGKRSHRYQVTFSPAAFILALDEVLEKAKVHLWLDTLACCPLVEDRRVLGVEVENKSGRGLLRAACTIDATGDADLLYRAGAPCAEAGNWLSYWAHLVSQPRLEQPAPRADRPSLNDRLLTTLGASNTGQGHPAGSPRFSGTDGEQVTRFILEGRRLLREKLTADHQSGQGLDRHNHFPELLPAMAQFRTTRRIIGRETLTDRQNDTHFDTSIGLCGDWRSSGPVWEIPYGTLVPQDVTGILAAGRCIASSGDAWEVTRVIPPAALTGQVAGMAAWLSLQHDTTPDRLDVGILQTQLRKSGIPLHAEELPRRD